MRRLILVLVVCVLLVQAGAPVLAQNGSSWPVSAHDASQTRFSTDTGITPNNVVRLHPVWSVAGVLQAVATPSRVYALTRGGTAARVLVLDSQTGRLVRSFTTATLRWPGGDNFNALAVSGDRLVIAGWHQIVAISPITGRQLWRAPGGAGSLVIAGGRIYTGKGCQFPCGGSLASFALDLQSGTVLWRHAGNFGGTPVLIGNRIYQVWGEMQGTTRVYDSTNGHLLGQLSFDGLWSGSGSGAFNVSGPVQPSGPSTLRSVGSAGKPLWTLRLGAIQNGLSGTVVGINTIYTPSNRFHPGIIAVAAGTGKVRWGADVGADVVGMAATSQMVFALQGHPSRLTVLGAGTGRVLFRLPLRQGVSPSSEVMLAGGTLYVPTASGLTALRP